MVDASDFADLKTQPLNQCRLKETIVFPEPAVPQPNSLMTEFPD